jgi:RNA-directed DNA polymerase
VASSSGGLPPALLASDKGQCNLEFEVAYCVRGVISPLLANIYLHRLDVEVRAAGFRLVRYADDFVVLADKRWKAEAADRLVRAILADIGLQVAEAKSGVSTTAEGFEFLGYVFGRRHIGPRPKAVAAFKQRVRQLTARLAPVSLQQMILDLNPVIRGWANYYSLATGARAFEHLDSWIRMRLRSKVLRRRTMLAGTKIPNKMLANLGLVSLAEVRLSVVLPR